ncbi:MAG: neutral/alkaline non-lysosomal ceramidase N-terminal domain-containing protein [Promethearchaeota archaeon]
MKVGFSELKITPDLSERNKPLQLAGYSPRKYCSGVHDDIYVRSVYFEANENDSNSRALLIVCDIIAIDGTLADIVKRIISQKIPINPTLIMISATHTHHAPDYKGFFRVGNSSITLFKGFFKPRPEQEELIKLGKKIIRCAIQAYKNRQESLIGVGQIEIPEHDRVMINRIEPFNFDKAQYPITIIKVISNSSQNKGTISGVIVNYACHGTVLPRENTLITADYIGYLVDALKREFPNAYIAYFNGPCGEINPLSMELKIKMQRKVINGLKTSDIYQQRGTWEDAKRIGDIIAKYSIIALNKIQCKDCRAISVLEKNIRIPIKDYDYGSDIRSALRRLFFRRKIKFFSALAKFGALKSSVFFKLDKKGLKMNSYVLTKLQIIEICDALILTAPGEYFLELGRKIIEFGKKLFPTKKIFMIELANDSIGYLYPIEIYLKMTYESTFSIIPLGGRYIALMLKQMLKKISKKN